jgi:hypothetical protein
VAALFHVAPSWFAEELRRSGQRHQTTTLGAFPRPRRRRHYPAISLIPGHLAITTFIAQANDLFQVCVIGGEMLFTIAFVLVTAWLLGVLGVYRVGDAMHVLLLVALMLLLVGFLKARDAAARSAINGRAKQP